LREKGKFLVFIRAFIFYGQFLVADLAGQYTAVLFNF